VASWGMLEHLSDRDLTFLAPGEGGRLRANPARLDELLSQSTLAARLTRDPEALLHVTPYLLFSVLLRQARRDLQERPYTMEWTAPRARVPVFDADQVAGFLAEPRERDYLVELLASFTRVYSGSVWRRTRHGYRRRRFSELDLASLEAVEAEAPDGERFYLKKRLGDAALFLTGVFPDHVGRAMLRQRSLEQIERDGAGWYQGASRHALARPAGMEEQLAYLASHFHGARKALNFVTDRYLYPYRANWFPAA
jgi:hypothetical protein